MSFLIFLNQLFPCIILPLRIVHRFAEIKHHKRSRIFLLGVKIQVGGHPFLPEILLRWQSLFDGIVTGQLMGGVDAPQEFLRLDLSCHILPARLTGICLPFLILY